MHFLSEVREGLLISFRAIRGNKMRSGLTTLGIVIGIVSVTMMATAIEGVTSSRIVGPTNAPASLSPWSLRPSSSTVAPSASPWSIQPRTASSFTKLVPTRNAKRSCLSGTAT